MYGKYLKISSHRITLHQRCIKIKPVQWCVLFGILRRTYSVKITSFFIKILRPKWKCDTGWPMEKKINFSAHQMIFAFLVKFKTSRFNTTWRDDCSQRLIWWFSTPYMLQNCIKNIKLFSVCLTGHTFLEMYEISCKMSSIYWKFFTKKITRNFTKMTKFPE